MINQEKQDIINTKGNVLVTANPGTGKTLLLAHKYLSLLKEGKKPEDILCLTFTEKAKREMEERILKLLKKENMKTDISKMNIFTFHSYALDNIDSDEIISSNLLRYAIFRFMKNKEVLTYGDSYLIEKIVPKMENLIRYLKSFGIMPGDIDIDKAKVFLEPVSGHTKEEIEKFADDFLDIFVHYERIKALKGVDYSDLLIDFLKIPDPPVFDIVMVDELQDVNVMEADIALRSGKEFIAVGDQKQAIFGFQGGSILNFRKFDDSTKKILSENFRSSNEILSYSKEFFCSNTEDDFHIRALANLKNNEAEPGNKPKIIEVSRNDLNSAACALAEEFSEKKGQTAIIARTNRQIMEISRNLKARGMDFSSTFFSASDDAKRNITTFIKGVLGERTEDIKNSMFTPFFPCTIQKAFSLAKEKDFSLDMLYEECPEFRALREGVKNVEDVNLLFEEKMIPISVSYGKEYLMAAVSMQNSYQEALKMLSSPDLEKLISYMDSSDLLASDTQAEKSIVLTTIHKAKGKEFERVIYIPSKPTKKENFQDDVVKAILRSKGIDATEELEEEDIRLDFVAFTRAKEELFIITDRSGSYLSDSSELVNIDSEIRKETGKGDGMKKAYTLFVNGDFNEARKALERKDPWLVEYVKAHFESLDRISFSSLKDSAYEYLRDNILRIREYNPALVTGNDVHKIAQGLCIGNDPEVPEELIPYKENLKILIDSVKEEYPRLVSSEKPISIPIKNMINTQSDMNFRGVIDAVFTNGDEYLIVDWKTDKNETRASKHRQQLESYRHAYSLSEGVPIDKIKVAIAFCALRKPINTGRTEHDLDARQPRKTVINTFQKKAERIISWKNDINLFFNDLLEKPEDDILWKTIADEYQKESK